MIVVLLFILPSKEYPEGVNWYYPWYIYLNPLCPEIYPVLYLANYLLAYLTLLMGDCRLFSGYFQYNRYMYIFCGFLKEYKDDFACINADFSDLGYHSARKGAATLCAS